jgi:phage portal protein, SPP1 family
VIFNNIGQISTAELIKIYMDEFMASPERKLMEDGEKYYLVENTRINEREMYRYEDRGGTPIKVTDEAKPNHKLAHGYMYVLIEDKINYLLAKPYSISHIKEGSKCIDSINEVLGKKFQAKRMTRLGVEASNKGIAWLHPYISPDGEFKTRVIPSEQCIPLWADSEHEELQAMIWFYDVEVVEGNEQSTVTKVEYWTSDGVAFYVNAGENLVLDAERYLNSTGSEENEFVEHFQVGKFREAGTWGAVPFVPFKNNDFEKPDLQFVKTIVDEYDIARSDIANTLDEVKSVIFGLKGYGGQDLSEFMRDLSYFRAISLDEDGGFEAYNPNLNIESAKSHYEALKKDIFDFGQGVDKNSDKLGNSPSGVALKFIYSGLDLKCNRMENAFAEGFGILLYFVNKYLELTGMGAEDMSEVSIVFNRDISINESQSITDCQNSKGLISDKTIIENHPWTTDVDEEIKQVESENSLADDEKFFKDKNSSGEDGGTN